MISTLSFGAAQANMVSPGAEAPASSAYDQAMLESMARSLSITPSAAAQRLAAEVTAIDAVEKLQATEPGVDGAFFSDDSKMTVNVRSQAAADKVRTAGLTPRLVTRSQNELAGLAERVGQLADSTPLGTVRGIGHNARDQFVTVYVGDSPAAKALRKRLTNLDGVVVKYRPQLATVKATQIGGNGMQTASSQTSGDLTCTQGFSGRRDGALVMLTVGHCYTDGRKWVYASTTANASTYLGQTIGNAFRWGATAANSALDVAIVQLTPSAGAYSSIWTHYTGYHPIAEAKAPFIGQTICKSGMITGWTCGHTRGYEDNVTVGDEFGRTTVVDGMWRGSLCTLAGDSGGPIVQGNFAVGLVSAGADVACGANSGFQDEVPGADAVGTFFPSVGLVLKSYPGTITNF
ncbi:S1 family peptidase [Kribbella sp. CA-293567]|uniref:S1 family peptidase n=1 Tax=Kribbella sp. CA-293567 TaxID=3002436 RepID=UPI0022DD2511|nr:S1 family peptidase [Kribbella sp. CA-293567]WBQ08706.1 S1 family peptidase [Kribbella sp. CA-293567]